MLFDVLVIGGGFAAEAAAMCLVRQKYALIVLAKQVNSQALLSEGSAQTINLKTGVTVTQIEKTPQGFSALLENGEIYEGKTVLVATGSCSRSLNVTGEAELYDRGVTHGMDCDISLYQDKLMFVVGGGNSAMSMALSLAKYAQRVTIVTANATLSGDVVMRVQVLASPNIRLETSTKVVAFLGKKQLSGLKLKSHDGYEHIEMGDGACLETGCVPAAQMLESVIKDTRGQIVVDKTNTTNVVGVWAAGDVTDVVHGYSVIAIGEGTKAALSIIHYFQTT